MPKDTHTAGVDLGGDDDDGGRAIMGELKGDYAHFVGGVVDGGGEDEDFFRRNAFVNQDLLIEEILSEVRDAESGHGRGGLLRTSKPNLGRVTGAEEAGGFEGAQGHASAENDDGARGLEGILDGEPAADEQQAGGKGQNQNDGAGGEQERGAAAALWRNDGCRRIHGLAHRIVAPGCGQLKAQTIN